MVNVNFIEKLKEDNKYKDLCQAFDNAYDRVFDYEINFKKDKAIFTINNKETQRIVATYILESFDLLSLSKEDDAISERYYGVTTAKSRKTYLTFMKRNFKDYKEEFIINAQQEAREKTIEIIAL